MTRTIYLAAIIALVVFSTVAGAYGVWEPDEAPAADAVDFSALEEAIDQLEASVQLAESSRSAHPDFLADLHSILALLRQESQWVKSQCQLGSQPGSAPPFTQARPGEPQYWDFSGRLTNDHQSDEYSIELQDNGDLFITVTTGEDLNLYGGVFLLERDGETRIYGANQGPGTTAEHHVPNLRAGTYRVRIVKDGRGFYHGPYTANLRFQPASVPNASGENWTIDTAYRLPLNTTISGHMGYRGQLESPQMESWYRVEVPKNGMVTLNVTTSGSSSTPDQEIRSSDGSLNLYGGVFLMDSDGETRIYGTNQGPATDADHEIPALRAGTYYVRIVKDGRGFYWGTYTLNVTNTPFTRAADSEPNDTPQDRAVAAVRVGQTVTGDLGTRGQGLPVDMVDYWRYDHPGGALTFTVQTSGGEQPDAADGNLNLYGRVALYAASDLSRAVFSTAHTPGRTQEYQIADLARGTYFFQLEKDGRGFYWGTYALTINQAGN